MGFIELGLGLVTKLVGIIASAATGAESVDDAVKNMVAACDQGSLDFKEFLSQVAENNRKADEAARNK